MHIWSWPLGTLKNYPKSQCLLHNHCQGGTDSKQWDDVTVVLGMVGLDGYSMRRLENVHNAAGALLGAQYHYDLRYEAPSLVLAQ